MTSFSPPHQRPRGSRTELHQASFNGSTERLLAQLSDGSIGIDQRDENGSTPLMIAASMGHSHVVRTLLDRVAHVSVADYGGFTALHGSAEVGYLAISKMLIEAGADPEPVAIPGDTPLHLAAARGHLGTMDVLIDAGANPNCRRLEGSTPLYLAAQEGQVHAVKALLRAKVNPLLTMECPETGRVSVALDVATHRGHLEVVRELVQQVGIEGCGGASEGIDALCLASRDQHLEIMALLTDAGVVDDGVALTTAAANGVELSMKFLLQQRKGDEADYVNGRDALGETPLLHAMGVFGISPPSPRIVRLLVDAGADTRSAVPVTYDEDEVAFNETPLATASRMLREKEIDGEDATEEQLHGLEGIRRLLLRVEAVHAVSFLWPFDIPSALATAEGPGRKVAASTPLKMMLPILRRRARRPRVLLAALWR